MKLTLIRVLGRMFLGLGFARLLTVGEAQGQFYRAGDTIQDFSLVNRTTRQPVRLSELAGKIVFLEWFAWWCPFCQASAPQVADGIVEWYRERGGNPGGIPVVHVAVNLQPNQEAQTQNFVDRAGFEFVLEDFNRALANRFQSGGQPIFAIINAVTNSPSHRPWQLLLHQNGYGQRDFSESITRFRAEIDAVQAPPAVVGKVALTVRAANASRGYGAANPSFSATYEGFVGSDTAAVLSGQPAFATDASAASGVGTYAITPSLGTLSAANYTFGSFLPGTLTVELASQTISFAPPRWLAFSSNPPLDLMLAGRSSALLPVAYSVVSGPAELTGSLLSITNPGPAVVRASQSGDRNFRAAPDVEATIWAIELRFRPEFAWAEGSVVWELAVEAMPGASVLVERSSSLTNWHAVTRLSPSGGRITIQLPATNTWEFYRAALEPPL